MAEDCILIHDAFPKAAHHALVLPRDPSLRDMRSLNRAHIPLLMHMKVGGPFPDPSLPDEEDMAASMLRHLPPHQGKQVLCSRRANALSHLES